MKTRLISYAVVAGIVTGYFFVAAAAAQPAPGQSASGGGTLRTVLASTALPSVVDAPRYFKMVRVNIPAKQATTYNGAVGFVLALSGSLEVALISSWKKAMPCSSPAERTRH
ncbi:MAG: hypothetical protein ACR2HE_05505 [Casimicrobiaceae bacterium]